MTKEQIIEDISVTFESNKKILVKCWNILFPEEKIGQDLILKKELQEEMSGNIEEELEYSDNFEVLSKLYRLCTGESIDPDDIYSEEDTDFEDDLYL